MNTEELIDFLKHSDQDALDLLNEINPNIRKRFLRACKSLSKIVDEVREVYPDANIYVQEDSPLLLLGCSHVNIGIQQYAHQEMTACESHDLLGKIDGGGW